MNKDAIKNFAVWARKKLVATIKLKASTFGITENGIEEQAFEKKSKFIYAIRLKEKQFGYQKAFQFMLEEVAYTWFKHFITIRFMEVNGYLPVRVLSSQKEEKKESDLMTTPFATNFSFSLYEKNEILQLKKQNKLDELFKMLFLKQCQELHKVLPEFFENMEEYAALFPLSFTEDTEENGIIFKLVHDIAENDFNVQKGGQVEIIGWLYQYYNLESKAAVFAKTKTQKIKKEEIPAATQVFTPHWIVHYMVENSLGRLWLEGHPNDSLKQKWNYYLEEAAQEPETAKKLKQIRTFYQNLKLEEIKLLDPCMGSGHILVYAFDVFLQIYQENGYSPEEATKSILKNNLYGIDIDKRAYQLSYFAIMMKARQYYQNISEIKPNLIFITNSKTLFPCVSKPLKPKQKIIKISNKNSSRISTKLFFRFMHDFKNAEEYGSLLKINYTEKELKECKKKIKNQKIIEQARFLSQKYHIVVTNPPYLPVKNTGKKLQTYVKQNYPDSKTDLFAVFIERGTEFLIQGGLQAMLTMHSWMFLSSYKTLRKKILEKNTILNMIHLGKKAFEGIGGEVVQTTAFVLTNHMISNYRSSFQRLVDFNSQNAKEQAYLNHKNLYQLKVKQFFKIPGYPMIYWANEMILKIFENAVCLKKIAAPKQGIATSNNPLFLRLWFEVDKNNLFLNCQSQKQAQVSNARWYPYNKGGIFRKWYGNHDFVIDWQQDGKRLKNFKGAVLRNPHYYFKECISWSSISSHTVAFRYKPPGHLFDVAGMSCFQTSNVPLKYLLALNNSCFIGKLMMMLAPTINYQVGNIANIPVIYDEQKAKEIIDLTNENIALAKKDWDSFETSWDFIRNPLLKNTNQLQKNFKLYQQKVNQNYFKMLQNEIKINQLFFHIYQIKEKIFIPPKDISHTLIYEKNTEITEEVKENSYVITKKEVVKHFISYAVGCMFGRYSLDTEGLVYAGGVWDSNKYQSFIPIHDNCIIITEKEFFDNDIVNKFVAFVKTAYGSDDLEENIAFIAEALEKKGKTNQEIIRNYFLQDFIKDHIKMYQKRPIYWLFDSGKKNGFKALVSMHRWNEDTIKTVYLHYFRPIQKMYEKEIENIAKKGGKKRKEKLQKQLQEIKDYEKNIIQLADSHITIDLDDGVKVNYEKVQTTSDGKRIQILTKI